MFRIYLFLVPLLFGCSSGDEGKREIGILLEESAKVVNEATWMTYFQIKENAYKYPSKAKPWLEMADQIDSIMLNFDSSLNILKKSIFKPSRAEYQEEFTSLIANVNRVIQSESVEPPEWFVLPSTDSFASLDSVNLNLLPAAIKLNLALFRSQLFRLLQLRAPYEIACYGKTIYIRNEEVTYNKAQFDLASRLFSLEENRYIEIDSVVRNGKVEDVVVDEMKQFSFQRVSLDSLKIGKYQVYGKVIAFSNGSEFIEPFNHEFKIK